MLTTPVFALTPQQKQEVQQIDDALHKWQIFIDSTKDISSEKQLLAQAYQKRAMLLQYKDTIVHQGGSQLKFQCLEAFDQALYYNDNSDVKITILIHYLKGIMLRTINDGDNSITALNNILLQPQLLKLLNKNDLSLLHFQLAETYFMIGASTMNAAIAHYYTALKMQPCHTHIYFYLVNALKERPISNTPMNRTVLYSNLYEEIKFKLQHCKHCDDPLEFTTSIEVVESSWALESSTTTSSTAADSYFSLDNGARFYNYKPTSDSLTHRALFLILEQQHEYVAAFQHLVVSNNIARQSKTLQFSASKLAHEIQQIQNIFTPAFLSDAKLGSKDKTVVFVVGMMR